MSDPTNLALLALGLPLLATILAAVMGTCSTLAKWAHLPVVTAFAGSAILALLVLSKVMQATGSEVAFLSTAQTWFHAGNLQVDFQITVDPLSALMLMTVTFVGTWIAVFSVGYMHDDPGYARYFSLMALFVFSMCLLILASDLLLLVAGWEGVGLCSYLLIGYYYAKPSAAAAARKAFLVTRLGDVGMILGIFLFWQAGGYHTNFDKLFAHITANPPDSVTLTTACLLLFCGAIGKSAQFPLYVWLPDAMEGPTPVSALIHAATMVTAGVYLLARAMPLFVLSPDAQIVVALIGGFTAILSAFIALAQHDLKRVLAYSTVSQLGYMFMALGAGGPVSANLVVTAAIFHVFTHAFFKALLFLSSGSVMHAMGNVIDMRKFGGLRTLMPVTHITFLCGAAALAGFPLLSGFWSKDLIIDMVYQASEHGGSHATLYGLVFLTALVTAFLTAFYTFRAYFLTFWGELRTPPEAGHHAQESPLGLLAPLIVLAFGAVLAGITVEPFAHGFSNLLVKAPSVVLANSVLHVEAEATHPHFDFALAGISTLLALSGMALAWWHYRTGIETVPAALKSVYRLSENKLYVDEIFNGMFVKPAEWLAVLSRLCDGLLDGVARVVSFIPRLIGALLKPLQNGLVQFYALGMVLGLAVFLTVVVVRTSQ
ncbi:MAG: NADH-quinone oxidoreductase subunit L [Bacteroidales bacterium]|nr:NADH-quinone oxidoreductase subunit L [Bacteroidales bacterium]